MSEISNRPQEIERIIRDRFYPGAIKPAHGLFDIDNSTGEKIEVKSSQICVHVRYTCNKEKQYRFKFTHINAEKCDIVILVVYAPDGLHVYRDQTKNIPTYSNGRSTAYRGTEYSKCFKCTTFCEAQRQILSYLKDNHEFIGHIPFNDITYTGTETQKAYLSSPIHSHNAGDFVESVVIQFLQRHRDETIMKATAPGKNVNNKNCVSNHDAILPYSNTKYEVKHGQMRYDKYNRRWEVAFRDIEPEFHDVLILAMRTPTAIYIFEYKSSFTHKKKYTDGYKLTWSGKVCAPVQESESILLKKIQKEAVHIGTVWLNKKVM